MVRVSTLTLVAALLLSAAGTAAAAEGAEAGNAAFFSRPLELGAVRHGSFGMRNVFFDSGRSLVAERPASVGQHKPEEQQGAFGWVDAGRVLERMEQESAPAKRLELWRERLRAEVAALTRLRYLTAAEREELAQLTAKGDVAANAGERRRLAELRGKSDALDKEAEALATLASPSPEQQQRREELSSLRKAAISSVQEETELRSQLLQWREGPLREMMEREMRECVRQIAERRRLIAVLDQRAVLHGGVDLTEEVLQKLGLAGK